MNVILQLAFMSKFHIPFWKDAPFVRIIIPFVLGIAVSYYAAISELLSFILLAGSLIPLICYAFFKIAWKFRFRYFAGLAINLFIFSAATFITALKNPFANGNLSLPADAEYIVTLKEPPAERKSSWKALCKLESIQADNSIQRANTDLLLYIKKDSLALLPAYEDRIAFKKTPEKIKLRTRLISSGLMRG